ncbi:helix-turn-helix domain-containing protein [Streptomyces sp. LHD-70]|uniref:helix-turn-helix domain-containing protein n=1 Tax=Streptomyces sp. LHD-70 TaxID=3072140 RepID=UPI0035BE64FA
MDTKDPPAWAMRRIASELAAGGAPASPAELARRTGLSKSLARRCLLRLRPARPRGTTSAAPPSPASAAARPGCGPG